MRRVNALELRQALGKVIAALERTGEPVILEKGRRPVAALVSLKDFYERFVEKSAREERQRILEAMDRLARPSSDRTAGADIVRHLRRDA